MTRWTLGVLLAMVASQALAAPFCVVTGAGTQCYYYDYPSCQRAAASAGGACVVQDERPQQQSRPAPASSGAPFCVAQSFGMQCYYYDAGSCQNAARSAGAACVVNPNR